MTDQPQEISVGSEHAGKAKTHTPRVVYAPGTPLAIRTIMDTIGRMLPQKTRLYVLPEKFLAKPIRSNFVTKLEADWQACDTTVFAMSYSNSTMRILTKEAIRDYILSAVPPTAKPPVAESEQVTVNEA